MNSPMFVQANIQTSPSFCTNLLNGKAKLGTDASIAAGPVGREAEASTNAAMSAQVLSYSRMQGVFAGVSLQGSSLGPDDDANKDLYGKKVTATEIITGQAGPPPASAKERLKDITEGFIRRQVT